MLAMAVEAAYPLGYKLTCSLYGQGDRQPSEVQEYGPMTHLELETLVTTLVWNSRPGWEYTALYAQPPLGETED